MRQRKFSTIRRIFTTIITLLFGQCNISKLSMKMQLPILIMFIILHIIPILSADFVAFEDDEKKDVEDFLIETDKLNNQLAAFIDEGHPDDEILAEAEKIRDLMFDSEFDFQFNDKGELLEGAQNKLEELVALFKANKGLRIGSRVIQNTELKEYKIDDKTIETALVHSQVTWLLNGVPVVVRNVTHFFLKTKDGWRGFGNGPQHFFDDFPESLPSDLPLESRLTVLSLQSKFTTTWGVIKKSL